MRRAAALVLMVLAGCAAWGPFPAEARGEAAPARRTFPTREEAGLRRGPARGEGGAGSSWWLGTAGVALALAAAGWASLAARKFAAGGVGGSGPAAGLRVVGRTSLSPKHTVYLLRAGGRVLIVGTGPQGPPSLLGEWEGDGAPEGRGADAATDADESPGPRRGARLDVRLGDTP